MIVYIIFFAILVCFLYYCYRYLTRNNLDLKYFDIAVVLFFLQVISIYGNFSSGRELFDIFTENDYLYPIGTRILGMISNAIGFCIFAEVGLVLVFIQIHGYKKHMKEEKRNENKEK